jgi:hypothetical protein
VPTSTNPWTWQPSLLRIDGSTGRVSGAWRLPDRGEAVAVGFGAVWVAGAHAVERFDLADMRTTTVTLDVPGDYSLTTVAVSDGSVWTGDCIDGVPSALFRVDPNGVNVTGTRRFGGCIVRLAPASSGLWLETLAQAAFARPFVRRLDATTLMDATRPTTFGPDLGITLLGEHAGTMWLYLNRGDARSSYLDRLDPTTGRPTSEPVPVHHPRGYWDASWPVYGEGAIWAMVQNTHQLAAIQMCATHLFFWHPCTALP